MTEKYDRNENDKNDSADGTANTIEEQESPSAPYSLERRPLLDPPGQFPDNNFPGF